MKDRTYLHQNGSGSDSIGSGKNVVVELTGIAKGFIMKHEKKRSQGFRFGASFTEQLGEYICFY